MCGIVGYLGTGDASPVLLDGLRRLEYRGYDSAGIAILAEGALQVVKRQGKLAGLAGALESQPLAGPVGIGHTRWATHGVPSDMNAHPHQDCAGRIALVHNGIIENYLPLRERLEAEGHVFTSETDTEVLAHLIETYFDGNLLEAVRRALLEVRGSYALAAICRDAPESLVAARLHSPLVIGHGEGEQFLASDVPALLAHTRTVTYLRNGEIAELRREGARVIDAEGRQPALEPVHVSWDAGMAEKGGYPHFMLKEIHEQPTAIANTLRGRLAEDGRGVLLPGLTLDRAQVRRIEKLRILACGTAYHAGYAGKYLIERLARLPVEVDVASECRYRDPLDDARTLTVVISQSGETADTLAAQAIAREKGSHVLAITNVVGSSVDREADSVLYTYAGPEIAVASTKAYTTQLMAVSLLALYLAEVRDTLPEDARARLLDALRRMPEVMHGALERASEVAELAARYHQTRDMLFLGRGVNMPTALEGALKLKEISYIHAEGYPAGEMKHGPIALVTPDCPTVAIAMPGTVYEKMLSNIKEVRARQGEVIAVGMAGDAELAKYADHLLTIPATEELLTPMPAIVPLQLFAYHCARCRGLDIDQPRNLAKSVTVE